MVVHRTPGTDRLADGKQGAIFTETQDDIKHCGFGSGERFAVVVVGSHSQRITLGCQLHVQVLAGTHPVVGGEIFLVLIPVGIGMVIDAVACQLSLIVESI